MQPPRVTPPDPFKAQQSTSIFQRERQHFSSPDAMLEAAKFLDSIGSQWARTLHLEARAWQAEVAAHRAQAQKKDRNERP